MFCVRYNGCGLDVGGGVLVATIALVVDVVGPVHIQLVTPLASARFSQRLFGRLRTRRVRYTYDPRNRPQGLEMC